MMNPDVRLLKVLGDAQEYLDVSIEATAREREVCRRIVDLYLNIARELEQLSRRVA
jgi:hypothetical protein